MKVLKISGPPPKASSPVCPTCGATLHAQAIVEAWLVPASWTFYGEPQQPGEDPTRWIRCQGQSARYRYTHFVVQAAGRLTHRLAWYEADQP